MKTYVYMHDGKIWRPKLDVNSRGFYEEELEKIKQNPNIKVDRVICIEEELEKYHLKVSEENPMGLSEEVRSYDLWKKEYDDKFLRGFPLPVKIKNSSEYKNKLKEELDRYINCLNRPAFIYEDGLLEFVENERNLILNILDHSKSIEEIETEIIQILSLFKDNSFFVSDLDTSYAFRGIAPFADLQSGGYAVNYKKMLDTRLTFYRARIKKPGDSRDISEVKDMLHLPYDLREKAKESRFSNAGLPGLYLGTTTYICSKECRWNGIDDLYASIFTPNSRGKKLRVLNLVISPALIGGIYVYKDNPETRHKLQNAMLKIFPLVLATSFTVEEETEEKDHYIISQLLMRAAHKCNIDGIAYLSMQGENELQYPQGVNLALPGDDITEAKQYSEKCSGFDVSKPVLYRNQSGGNKESYINENFKRFSATIEMDGKRENYKNTNFGRFDDYLASINW